MSKVSEMDMDYNFDCYFRQSWHDNRLAYRNGPSMIAVNFKLIEHLWKPFTYVIYIIYYQYIRLINLIIFSF